MESIASPRARLRPGRPILWIAGILGLIAISAATIGLAAGFFDRDPIHLYGMDPARPSRVAAVYFSGDMGLRFGMGTRVAPALAARGIPVFGISSPTIFNRQRSQAEVNALVANTVRDALARSDAARVILMGQSFGSDILVAGMRALPADLRAKVAAIILVVPGQSAYFHADPTGLRYSGAPDANLVREAAMMTWAPVICIYGQSETDSLCPSLLGKTAKVIELPGGHFLHRDSARLIAAILTALQPILQQDREQMK